VFIAGVQLSDSCAAHLAVLLAQAEHRSPAQRIGIAIDRDVEHVGLLPGEAEMILSVLHDPPTGLEELRSVLSG
jgi:hypothetical protein